MRKAEWVVTTQNASRLQVLFKYTRKKCEIKRSCPVKTMQQTIVSKRSVGFYDKAHKKKEIYAVVPMEHNLRTYQAAMGSRLWAGGHCPLSLHTTGGHDPILDTSENKHVTVNIALPGDKSMLWKQTGIKTLALHPHPTGA
jgi:hypothetical protein